MSRRVDWENPISDDPLNTGLVSRWQVGEDNPYWGGPKFYDLCGQNHGTLTGVDAASNPWVGALTSFGAISLVDPVTPRYVNIGSPASLTNLTRFTVSAWVRYASYQTINYTVAKYPGWGFGMDGTFTGTAKLLSFDGTTVLYGNTALSLNRTYHIALTYNGTTTSFYLDGKPDGSGAQSYPSDSGNNLLIGNRGDILNIQGSSQAIIDDVRIHNRTLADAEIFGLSSREQYDPTLNWISTRKYFDVGGGGGTGNRRRRLIICGRAAT